MERLRPVVLATPILLALLVSTAAPFARPANAQGTPEWLSAESAARLDAGFDVLVPGWVPAPFAGEPSISAWGGGYALYWVNWGGPPTFLEITGTAGGDIPDYSAYDRNVQLLPNATVAGAVAYHDLTSAYDLVYWRVGDVVYSVNSQNLLDTDSLSLANALMPLTAQVPPPPDGAGGAAGPDQELEPVPGPEPEVDPVPIPGPESDPDPDPGSAAVWAPDTVAGGETTFLDVWGTSGAVLTADAGLFLDTGTGTYDGAGGFVLGWVAPRTETDRRIGFVLTDGKTGEFLASASTLVLASEEALPLDPTPAPSGDPTAAPAEPISSERDRSSEDEPIGGVSDPGSAVQPADGNPTASAGGRTGVGGTGPAIVGSDGTGGPDATPVPTPPPPRATTGFDSAPTVPIAPTGAALRDPVAVGSLVPLPTASASAEAVPEPPAPGRVSSRVGPGGAAIARPDDTAGAGARSDLLPWLLGGIGVVAAMAVIPAGFSLLRRR